MDMCAAVKVSAQLLKYKTRPDAMANGAASGEIVIWALRKVAIDAVAGSVVAGVMRRVGIKGWLRGTSIWFDERGGNITVQEGLG